MAFQDGDFLEIEYSMWDAADNSLITTTDEKRAKEAKIYNDKQQYGPVLIIVGSPGVIVGLSKEIKQMNASETKKFTFKPTEAFGERSEELVRVMPLSEFRSRDIDPYPGMQVNLDSATAIVKSVNSGRVVVDANHPFAGKNVIYEVRIAKHLTADKDKLQSLSKSYGIEPTEVKVAADNVEMLFNDKVAKNADYFVGKASTIASAFGYLKNIKKIEVKEEYLRPPEEKKSNN